MVDEKKKKKLTLTASPKKPVNVPLYIQDRKKTSVIVEKRVPKNRNEKKFYSRNDNLKKSTSYPHSKPKTFKDSSTQKVSPNRSFEIRKIAEERATRRFKNLRDEDDKQSKKSSLAKDKGFISKRETKFTLSKVFP